MSHREAAIRHAAIALGALHRRFFNEQPSATASSRDPDPNGFALEQYVKALGILVQPIREGGKQATDVALMACVLFVLFEVSNTHSRVGRIVQMFSVIRQIS